MKFRILTILIAIQFFSCGVTSRIENDQVSLKFLDEYILDEKLEFEDTKVGGLSGIDYDQDQQQYYLVSDQPSTPRFYTAKINLSGSQINNVEIKDLIKIESPQNSTKMLLDLEGLRYNSSTKTYFAISEGKIATNNDPGVYELSTTGEILRSFSLPDNFRTNGEQKPRNNGVFEGISRSVDDRFIWVATELPLEKDASKPKIFPTRSHVRITKFDLQTGKAVTQFAYQLDGIAKLPINYFAVNGITEILEYTKDRFLIMERAYSAGYGSKGNTVKIFEVDATRASNVLHDRSLKKASYQKATKKLIFNFKSIKDKLTNGIIDNMEGMTFGPVLSNGNRSLILVSDNNFNSFAKQLNQFILMELHISE